MKEDEKTHEKTINQYMSMKKDLDKLNKGSDSHVINKMMKSINLIFHQMINPPINKIKIIRHILRKI